jgi:hypothetical protein
MQAVSLEVAQTDAVRAHHVGCRWSGSSNSSCLQTEQRIEKGSAEVEQGVVGGAGGVDAGPHRQLRVTRSSILYRASAAKPVLTPYN